MMMALMMTMMAMTTMMMMMMAMAMMMAMMMMMICTLLCVPSPPSGSTLFCPPMMCDQDGVAGCICRQSRGSTGRR
jgi:hypothetical protein